MELIFFEFEEFYIIHQDFIMEGQHQHIIKAF